MKIITVIAERVSAEALSAALPTEGVASVTVSETQTFNRVATAVQSYRGRKIPQHFGSAFRIEIAVEDDAVERVVEGIAFARSAGLFGAVQARISEEAATDLFTAVGALALSA